MANNKKNGSGSDIENLLSSQDNSTSSAVEEAIAHKPAGMQGEGEVFKSVPIGTEWFPLTNLEDKYTLDEGAPIRELSTEFATAYKVKEKKLLRKTGDAEIYALIFQKGFGMRLRAMAKLAGATNPNMQNILDVGIITSARTGFEHFAIILPVIQGLRLSELLSREGTLPEKFVNQIVVPSVNNALAHISKLGLLHGRINLNTLIFQPDMERVVVTECFSDYCGLSQPGFYEPIERAECLPIAKGEADESADYFALGAVICALLLGEGIFDIKRESEILADRLARGTFSAYIQYPDRFGIAKELLRGLLQDYAPERWTANDVFEWQARKKISAGNTSKPLKESLTGFEFNGKVFLGRRSLAQEIYLHWTPAKIEIKVEDLGRWLRLNVMRPDLSDELDLAINAAKRKEAVIQDDDLTKIISIIDPEGPIRHTEFSAMAYGLPQMMAYGLGKGKREYAQFVADCFNRGLLLSWLELQQPLDDYDYYKMYWNPTNVGKHLRKNAMGFGIERALYDLNPGLPCQSPLTQKNCVLSLHDALEALEEQSEDLHEKQDPLDRHLAAFLASRLGLEDEIRIKSIRHFPNFAKNPQLAMIALLTLAQTEAKNRSLKNLCRWALKRLGPLIASVQGKTIRKEFQSAVEEAAKAGDLRHLFNMLTSPNFIKRDAFGLSEAMKEYQHYSNEINVLKKQESIERVAYQYGLRVAMFTSYVVCFGTLVALVLQM